MRVAPPQLASRLARAGTPKGTRLATLREEFGEGIVELQIGGVPDDFEPAPGVARESLVATWGAEHTVRFSLEPWRDADPAKTRLIMSHTWRPTPEQEAAISASPREGDDLRQAWVAANAAGDEESAAALLEQMEEELGSVPFSRLSAWDPERAVEIAPGVLVQDERPGR